MLRRILRFHQISIFILIFIFASLGLQCFIAVPRLLLVVASGNCSLVTVWVSPCGGFCCEVQALGHADFSSCGTLLSLLHGMWDLPRPAITPMSPALAGRLLTTGPPGKSASNFLRSKGCDHLLCLTWAGKQGEPTCTLFIGLPESRKCQSSSAHGSPISCQAEC